MTGAARYSYEEQPAHVAYAVIVTSTIAVGRIASIDGTEALSRRGVLAVLTHDNAPRVRQDAASPGDRKLRLLQDDRVLYDRQPVALVVAESFEVATEAAARVPTNRPRRTRIRPTARAARSTPPSPPLRFASTKPT